MQHIKIISCSSLKIKSYSVLILEVLISDVGDKFDKKSQSKSGNSITFTELFILEIFFFNNSISNSSFEKYAIFLYFDVAITKNNSKDEFIRLKFKWFFSNSGIITY